jgi:hypothetical protein
VRRPSPKAFVIIGVVASSLGAVGAMVFALAQSSCQDGPGGVLPNPAFANTCSGQAWGARAGFIVLVLGALTIVTGVILSTPLFSGPKAGEETDGDDQGDPAVG